MAARWLRYAVLAVTMALLSATVGGCGRTPRPAASATSSGAVTDTALGLMVIPPRERQPAPPIAGETLSGGTFDLNSVGGRPVILNAWASWCAPCRDETPLLVDLAGKNPDVAFVGLDVQDRPEAARAFATEMEMPYPSIVDADGTLLAGIPGVPPRAVPSTVAVDRRGRIAARVIGPIEPAMIPELLAAAGSTTA